MTTFKSNTLFPSSLTIPAPPLPKSFVNVPFNNKNPVCPDLINNLSVSQLVKSTLHIPTFMNGCIFPMVLIPPMKSPVPIFLNFKYLRLSDGVFYNPEKIF